MSDEFTIAGPPNAFKDAAAGTTVTGRIVNREKRQSTDMDGKPKVWDSGEPMMEWVITIATTDGDRRLFAKGAMLTAIKQAVKDAGSNSLDLHATLTVTRVKEEKLPSGYKRWLYDAKYVPGEPPADEDW